jgi:putative exporter of polyketide antibiotics
MTGYLVIVAVGAVAILVLTELIAAALPVVIVIAMVPPEEREGLAKLLAACDSSRKLRLWRALRAAVRARRTAAGTDRK